MTSAGLAWRSLTRQPARAVLGVLGVAAVGALLLDMLLLSRGLMVSFRDLLQEVGYDVRVTATTALPGLGPEVRGAAEVARELRVLPGIEEVVPLRFGSATIVPDDPRQDGVRLNFMGSEGEARGSWVVLEGSGLSERDTEGLPPLVVNRLLAERLDLTPGATVRLIAGTDRLVPSVAFRLVGIAEFRFATVGEATAVTTLAAHLEAFGLNEPAADVLLVASAAGVDPADTVTVIRGARPDLHVFSVNDLLERFRVNEFSYFRQVSFVLTTITLFFAFLLVATLLTVSVNQRFGEIAGLRALGFSRRRVVADLLWESALFVGVGGVLALPLGGLLALRLDAILRTMPGLPERFHFFVYEHRAVVLYGALMVATGLLAASYPAWLAARLPIARTLRNELVG